MNNFEKILNLLSGVRPATQDNMNANCPCKYHDKENNHKLYLKDTGNVVTIFCQSGCTGHEIMQAIGLQLRDLYPARTKADIENYRHVISDKRKEAIVDEKGFKLWVELSVLQQAIGGRIYGEDSHPEKKHDCWDREKQALRLLSNLLNEYYK